ncbi:hypothetical protein OROMI_019929 [Orobanche minor]
MDSASAIKKMKIQLSLYFPEDIVEDILSRLPVEALLRFRCVSKSWYSLIGSKRFIKRHLERSTKNRSFPYQSVLVMSKFSLKLGLCSLQSLLNRVQTEPTPIDAPTNNNGVVVGCRDGLVCIFGNEDGGFLMWNPSTRVVRKLPQVVDQFHRVDKYTMEGPVVGWEESRDAYKVFVFLHDLKARLSTSRLYSSETDSWETFEHPPTLANIHGDGQFLNGKFHWHTIYHKDWRPIHDIRSFDCESGVFGVIERPSDHYSTFTIAVVENCLAMVNTDNHDSYLGGLLGVDFWGIDVWIMKEYGVRESWQKLVSVDLLQLQRELQLQPPFVIGPDGA